MTEVICSNGVKLTYDETLEQGDLITGYQKGYFTFDRFEYREGTTPLVYAKQRYDQNGKPRKSIGFVTCDASYCRKAKPVIEQQILAKQQEIATLQQIVSSL